MIEYVKKYILSLQVSENNLLIIGLDVGQVIQLKNVGEMFRKIPLPEDVMLKGLPVLKNSHDAVDWEYLHHHCLHAKEEVSVNCKDILRPSQSDMFNMCGVQTVNAYSASSFSLQFLFSCISNSCHQYFITGPSFMQNSRNRRRLQRHKPR
jgi:hypothetical protein